MKTIRLSFYFFCCLIALSLLFDISCKRTTEAKEILTNSDSLITDTILDKAISGNSQQQDSLNNNEKCVEPKVSSDKTKVTLPNPNKATVSGFEPYPGFVLVREYVPDLVEDIRYFTTNNFMGAKVNGYNANAAILSKQAAKRLSEAADEFRSMGYVIKIYDAYRPQQAVDYFVKWAQGPDQKNKNDYYPTIEKRNLFPRYIARKSGHSKGSTVDLTICYKDTKKEVDMGSHFDYFGPPSHTAYLGAYPGGNVNKIHNKNRMMLKRVMEKHGFTNYSNEWWHYTLNNQPYPNSYFNFPVRDK